MKEIKQIIHAFDVARSKGQKTALVTVVHVEGSSYRGPGARMLITDEGMLTGAISGGCLEGDALRKALMVMMEGKPLLTIYDTSDEEDAVIGVGLGCNGIIKVLIEPIVEDDENNPIALLKATIENREPSVLVTFFNLETKRSQQQGTRLLVKKNFTLATERLPLPMARIEQDVEIAFNQQTSAFVRYDHKTSVKSITAFIEYMAPAISLVVAGAGNDVLPLVQMAEVLGWDVTLIDGRPRYANEQRFPNCQLIVSEPEKALKQISIDGKTAFVLMTHNYNYDKSILRVLFKLPVNYIGILGPKKKLKRMLDELTVDGFELTDRGLSNIHSPVGLNIGAETSEEIALSILAEIKAVFHKKNGEHLRDAKGNIHERSTAIMVTSI
ncbi:XdhC family protein [Olivibacter sp. SDN3]|uniref:XdhC family protein n=1 Tax=Olivibacter sp. SDN3 TaxID=2764720 RepID=UPI0016511B79|nr:XdhC/CoxI family protein [Olivibacter sp. SDN3]QNL50162.1 XdhC family protein [Olivibacter sp. SDN3]